MKKQKMLKKNGILKGVSLFLVVVLAVNSIVVSNRNEVKTRRVTVSAYLASDKYTSSFDKSNVSYDEEAKVVNFVASSSYSSGDAILFDDVSWKEYYDEKNREVVLDDEDIENEYEDRELIIGQKAEKLPEADIPNEKIYEKAEVEYECSFDMEELEFNFTAELVAEDGSVLDTEEIETDAIITENGGLDANIEIDGKIYKLSDYEKTSAIDECSIIDVMKVVNAYLAVAETAEKVKAKSNYKYNKQLESDGKGVGKGYYIYDQTNTTTKNRKAGNYKFGFTTFKNVGCEVASAYNVSLSLGESERLSQTIYYFEAYAIEFSIGWGNLGSNPLEIYRYLKKRGFSYSKYTSYKKFSAAVAKKSTCKIIMSRWNSNKKNGLHTFFVSKTGKKTFYGYNWKYSTSSKKATSLSSFNDGSGFIVGYIVWK